MATTKQIEANRRNARKCTGPKTEEGKARASQNALKTGLYSETEAIGSESRDDYNALIAEHHKHFAPATPQERSLVDALIRYEWLSRRYMAAEAAVWNYSLANAEVPDIGATYIQHSQTISRASRAFNTARRGYATALKDLEAAQAQRKAEEARFQTEPKQSKPLDDKSVSFRQLQSPSVAEPKPLTRTAPQGIEIPPLAA